MAEVSVSDVGEPRPEQDRFTAQFIAQYLQWDASPVTVHWGCSRLVEENANPAQRIIKLKVEEQSKPLVFPELEDRCYDLWIINKTGWKVHAPPPPHVLRKMHEDHVRVHIVRDGVLFGAPGPGALAVIPNCEDGIILTAFGQDATLLALAFPM